MTRIAALDYGSRRIGLALAEVETGMAFARPAFRHRGRPAEFTALTEALTREGAERVVVGLPLLPSGEEGDQASRTRAFGELLAAAGFDVVYWDERLSTWQARADLSAAGRRTGRTSGELDSAAARVFLQDYLDALRAPRRPHEETE